MRRSVLRLGPDSADFFVAGDLLVRVGVKEMADPIPICYCFGFTRRDIHDEIAETGRSRIARADFSGSKSWPIVRAK